MNRNKRQRLRTRKRVLICVEGKTEEDYFKRLNQDLRLHIAADIRVINGKGNPSRSMKKCIDELKKEKESFDLACLVVDTDSHKDLDRVIKDCNKENIDVVITNPQFELWLLWHKTDQSGAITSTKLTNMVKELGLVNAKHVKSLSTGFPIRNYELAMVRATHSGRLEGQAQKDVSANTPGVNPYSGIPWLIEAIKNL